MWRVTAFSNGTWREIKTTEISDRPPTSAMAREMAASAFGNEYPRYADNLLGHLDEELTSENNSEINARRDAIELWNALAQKESTEFNWSGATKIEALEEALAIYMSETEGKPLPDGPLVPHALAWHDRTTVIIPLATDYQQVVVEYVPGPRDENRVERLRHRYAGAQHKLETILDWRGYFGSESAVVDGWTAMRSQGYGFVATLKGTTGMIIGQVARRLSRPQPALKEDPTALSRLAHMAEKHPSVAAACPDLARTPAVERDSLIVFVHGTVSCGLQSLKDFYRDGDPMIFRYEHDTFQAVADNGNQLADLICEKLRTKKLLLAGHSRGGLVARFAADQLSQRKYPADVQVFTFGTPHLGTPLATMANELMNLLFKLSGEIIGAVPVLTPLAKAYSYLVKTPALPAGIKYMEPESDGLKALNSNRDANRVLSWGSSFYLNGKKSGFGIFTTGLLLGALGTLPHDLVVPMESALGFGTLQPLLDCAHTEYFKETAVQEAIRNFYSIAVSPVLKLKKAAAAEGTEVTTEPRPNAVVAEGDHVLIGGLRVPVRKTG